MENGQKVRKSRRELNSSHKSDMSFLSSLERSERKSRKSFSTSIFPLEHARWMGVRVLLSFLLRYSYRV